MTEDGAEDGGQEADLLHYVDRREGVPEVLAVAFSAGCTCRAFLVAEAAPPAGLPAGDWWLIAHQSGCAYAAAMLALDQDAPDDDPPPGA